MFLRRLITDMDGTTDCGSPVITDGISTMMDGVGVVAADRLRLPDGDRIRADRHRPVHKQVRRDIIPVIPDIRVDIRPVVTEADAEIKSQV